MTFARHLVRPGRELRCAIGARMIDGLATARDHERGAGKHGPFCAAYLHHSTLAVDEGDNAGCALKRGAPLLEGELMKAFFIDRARNSTSLHAPQLRHA
ncbi:MAG: hypothetical protein ABJE66_04480 [Deltaproteobacteria bacterium]